MNPYKISAHSDNKQKSYGMLLVELVTWGVTNRDVLLLATIRYIYCDTVAVRSGSQKSADYQSYVLEMHTKPSRSHSG